MSVEAITELVVQHERMSARELWRAVGSVPLECWSSDEAYRWFEQHDHDVDRFLEHALATMDADSPADHVATLAETYVHALVHMPDAYDRCMGHLRRFARLRLASVAEALETVVHLSRSPDATLTQEQTEGELRACRDLLAAF